VAGDSTPQGVDQEGCAVGIGVEMHRKAGGSVACRRMRQMRWQRMWWWDVQWRE
jgi:hypothetical protein